MSELDLLRELQGVDSRLGKLDGEKRTALARAGEVEKQIAAVRAAIEGADEKITDLKKARDRKELELKTIEEKVQRLRLQQQTVKTNKEYSALSHEIAAFETDYSRTEDFALMDMEKIEETENEKKKGTARVAELQKRLAEVQAEIADETAAMDEERSRLEAARAAVVGRLKPQTVTRYERVLEAKDGLAVVPVRGQTCGGCYMLVTPQTINLLMGGRELVSCAKCNRFLYLPDEEREEE